jgi:hypothetical protein
LHAVGVELLYSQTIHITHELKSLAVQAALQPSCMTERFLTRPHHLRSTLQHLKELGVFPKEITDSHYSDLTFRHMERKLKLTEVSESPAGPDPERRNESVTDQTKPLTTLSNENLNGVSTGPLSAHNDPVFRTDCTGKVFTPLEAISSSEQDIRHGGAKTN